MAAIRALVRLHLHAFVRGPLPILFALGTVCGVVFSRNGLDPHDVPRIFHRGGVARALLIAFVVALTRASSRSMVFVPGAAYVRASPIPRLVQIASAGVAVLAVQLPWLIVFVAGGAPVEGVGLACAMASACIAPTSLEVLLSVAVGALAAPVAPLVLMIVLARAFREAPVWSASTMGVRLRAPWWVLLAAAYARSLVRGGLARVALAFAAAGLGAAMVSVAAHDERADRAVSLAAVIAALSAAPLLSPVARVHRAVTPWVRASARPRRLPLLIAIAVVATPSVAFAAGAAHVSAHAQLTPLSTAFAVVAVLVVLQRHLARTRKDASLVTLLLALPLVVVFTLLARSVAFAAVATGLALVAPDPEVVRADDR